MSQFQALKKDYRAYTDLQSLVAAFEEVAAVKMQQIRHAIVKSRLYYQELAAFSVEIGADLGRARAANGKTARLLLTPDDGVYGELLSTLIATYVKDAGGGSDDLFVVGRFGVRSLPDYDSSLCFTELRRDDYAALIPYSTVVIYYGMFSHIALQQASKRELSTAWIEDTLVGSLHTDALHYIYEPSIADLEQVFRDGLMSHILVQTEKENELAMTASRLMQLDLALDTVESKTDSLSRDLRKMVQKRNFNRMRSKLTSIKRLRTSNV